MRKSLMIVASLGLVTACVSTDAPPPPMPPPASPPPPPPPPPPPGAMYETLTVTAMRMAAPERALINPGPRLPEEDRDRFEDTDPNPVVAVSDEPVSTFSIDVDTASYAVARNFLQDGQLPPSDAVRVEEFVNYFDYAYAAPDSLETPFATHVEVTPNPWNPDTSLMHVGIQGYEIEPEARPRANLVFLVDVSGSMNAPDKLPLAVEALHMMVEGLQDEDTVALVVYAGAAGAVLEPTEARDARRIHEALDSLHAGGSTAGGAGLALAYNLAERNFDEDAINRVMLLTDGDFNVGVTQDERLEDFVARKRETGIYLSVFGFGRGNYNDQMMQTIAQAGNGIAGYIDSREEARRLLVEASGSTLVPIANDVKIQVEFNPARVAEYRLIGYETRLLDEADFNNDAVDAGEIGAGHSVTAIYEIAEPGSDGLLLEPSRYAPTPPAPDALAGEYAFLRIRYKAPGEDESQLIERPITDQDAVSDFSAASQPVRFSTHVAGFAQLLRNDPYVQQGDYSFETVHGGAEAALGPDELGYRSGFLDLVERADRLASGPGPKTP